MSAYDQDFDDYCYDDGRFVDDGEEGETEEYDDFGIPTYDELDLEGRYYTYGSRSDYNAWRNEQICALREALRPAPVFVPRKEPNNHARKRHKPDEHSASGTRTDSELSPEKKAAYSSGEVYKKWRGDYLKKKHEEIVQKREDREFLANVIEWTGIIVTLLCLSISFFSCNRRYT